MAASLGLQPHPEGGYYLETYRAPQTLRTPRGERAASTAIVFLVTEESVSRLHRLSSDELWIYQGGLPLELVTISPEGELRDARARRPRGDRAQPRPRGAAHRRSSPWGCRPVRWTGCSQALVPAGSWQGARLAGGPHLPADYAWALVSCVVTPGFDFADFEIGEREALLAAYPQHAEVIGALS